MENSYRKRNVSDSFMGSLTHIPLSRTKCFDCVVQYCLHVEQTLKLTKSFCYILGGKLVNIFDTFFKSHSKLTIFFRQEKIRGFKIKNHKINTFSKMKVYSLKMLVLCVVHSPSIEHTFLR